MILDVLAFLIVIEFVKVLAEDGYSMVTGKPNPRLERRRARQRSRSNNRVWGALVDYLGDVAEDAREQAAEKRRQQRQGAGSPPAGPQPVHPPRQQVITPAPPTTPVTPAVPVAPAAPVNGRPAAAPGGWRVASAGPGGAPPPRVMQACPRCGQQATLTSTGWCSPCSDSYPHGFCPVCSTVVRLDGDVWRHGDQWPCRHVESAAGHLTTCAGGCGKTLPMHPSMTGWRVRCADCRKDAVEPVDIPLDDPQTPQPTDPAAAQPQPVAEASTEGTDALIIPLFPTKEDHTMTATTGEATGLVSAMNHAEALRKTYENYAAMGDTFVASLAAGEVSGEAVAAAQRAREAEQLAAAEWAACHTALAQQLHVKEAYNAAPDAGSKQFVTSE